MTSLRGGSTKEKGVGKRNREKEKKDERQGRGIGETLMRMHECYIVSGSLCFVSSWNNSRNSNAVIALADQRPLAALEPHDETTEGFGKGMEKSQRGIKAPRKGLEVLQMIM